MAVDWAGQVCDYDRLERLGVPIIQDGAHSFGGWNKGHYVTYSFQAIKHLTTGDGGALFCPTSEYERAKLLRWYGLDRTQGQSFRCTQDITEAGWKYHMNDVTASIGLANLAYMEDVLEKYECNAQFLYDTLPYAKSFMVAPESTKWNSTLWFLPVLVSDREAFKVHMAEWGVETSPVHRRNDVLSIFDKFRTDLPGVDEFSAHAMGLPCHYAIGQDDLNTIVKAVEAWA